MPAVETDTFQLRGTEQFKNGVRNKNFFAKSHGVDENGQYSGTKSVDGTKIGHDGADFLEHFSNLAKLNPRFNRFINPLYFIGYDKYPSSPFLDSYFNGQNTEAIDRKISEISSAARSLSPGKSMAILNVQVPTKRTVENSYLDLFVPPQKTAPETYLDSLILSGKGRVYDLIDNVDAALDKAIESFAPNVGVEIASQVNSAVNFFTGIDLLGMRAGAISEIKQRIAGEVGIMDSEDPNMAAQKGLIAGQSTGKAFIPYYKLETGGRTKDEDFLEKVIGDNTGQNVTDFNPIHWHLPYSDPTKYTLDQRMKYMVHANANSTNSNVDALDRLGGIKDAVLGNMGSDLFDDFLDVGKNVFSGIGDAISNVNLSKVASDVGNALGDAFNSGTDFLKQTLESDGENINTFLKGFLPETKKDGAIWDNIIDLFLTRPELTEGKVGILAHERHKEYVASMPIGESGRWWTILNDSIFEEDHYFSDRVTEVFDSGSVRYPNVKAGKTASVLESKQEASEDDGLIFEGVQQVDGSYKGVEYDGPKGAFMPQSQRADVEDSSYLANVKSARISKVLGEVSAGTPRKRSLEDWKKEPQRFPFYVRTISRDDFAQMQQPYYDNHGAYMSKKRLTGNSIVFLEAANVTITEGFQSDWTKEKFLGRTEPILTYQGTQRNFSVTFEMMATRPQDVPSVRSKVQELVRMMYPQVMAITDVGVVGFRRGPMIELRLGDSHLLQGGISSLQLDWGGESKVWETIPGGRVLRGCKLSMNLEVISYEQPHAGFEFFSSTFEPKVFFPGHLDRSSQLSQSSGDKSLADTLTQKVQEALGDLSKIADLSQYSPDKLRGIINF